MVWSANHFQQFARMRTPCIGLLNLGRASANRVDDLLAPKFVVGGIEDQIKVARQI